MGAFLDEVLDEMICVFQIHDKSMFEVKKEISKGFSAAEVYLVELGEKSVCQGSYFLKIDTDGEEFSKNEQGYQFSKVAAIVKAEKIRNYYVMLLQLAGQSLLEYTSFYEIESPSKREAAIRRIIPNILEESVQGRSLVPEEMEPTELFNIQLMRKLESDSPLAKYVEKLTGIDNTKSVTAFEFKHEFSYPNAYAYATNPSLWDGDELKNVRAYTHGDFHGNNVFYSIEQEQYALIDMALYREDGYVFYDSAYFELSLLLTNLEQINLDDWLHLIRRITGKQWKELECKDCAVFQAIYEEEINWIDKRTDVFHSHKDILIEARWIARTMAGLNYAGKKYVSSEIRRKAFLFACINLEKLLEIKKVVSWKTNTIEWREIEESYSGDINLLTEHVDNFSDIQKYILILGDQCKYDEAVYEALARIHWCGVITFKRQEEFEKVLKKYNVVNVVTTDCGLDLITPENFWCFYADGVDYIPDTIKENFSQWRNLYVPFLNRWVQKIDDIVAPDELQIIIDLNSFSRNYYKHLNRLCEAFDMLENTNVNVAVLASRESDSSNINGEYERITCEYYNTSLGAIANFCLKYLSNLKEDNITIPAIGGVRKVISSDNYNFIKTTVSVLHNKVMQYEGYVDENEKSSFYYGKKIIWQAIEEKLYVEREEYVEIKKELENKLKEDNSQFMLQIKHTPGAGASTLCRILCWEYRNRYPVVIVEKMSGNVIECLQQLYSLSGLHILLYADGEFSRNDVDQILRQSRYRGIKIGIIFPLRYYRNLEREKEKSAEKENQIMLSILSADDALNYSREYSRQMRILKNYPEEMMHTREENMQNLARKHSLINYRLPFFFGINAFEEDFLNIQDYLKHVLAHVKSDEVVNKVVNYIALITYYTEEDGLNISYVKKILKADKKMTLKDMLQIINGSINNFVYYLDGVFKICHSVVAYDILVNQFEMESVEYEAFLEQFVRDICNCEGKNKISDRLDSLLMNLFIKRDIEGDVADNLRRKNFSPIVLSMENSNLQEKFFAFLSQELPKNAHFRQHYGRLIIYNDPDNLEGAKEQFDTAIALDPQCPLHYHARGNMYTKYVMNLCKNKDKDNTIQEVFDKISEMTECAVSDYEKSISIILENNDITVDLSYPYASLIQTITYVVHHLYTKQNIKSISEKDFLNLNMEISKWCKMYVHKAEKYDINTENRYDIIRSNEFYNNTRTYLMKYRYSEKDMISRMRKEPHNLNIMKDYLYSIDTKKEPWMKKSQEDLERVIRCCREIISGDGKNEGILWKWFNASLNLKKVKIVDMIAFLETMDKEEKNLTVQFMLYVIKLGKYFQSLDERTLHEILKHIDNCRKLNQNSDRGNTRYYYDKDSSLGFCHDRDKGVYLNGKVTHWISHQNGRLSIALQPSLSAFFVPSIINMREEGAVGTEVRFRLGVSFDGLRAWDVEIIPKS